MRRTGRKTTSACTSAALVVATAIVAVPAGAANASQATAPGKNGRTAFRGFLDVGRTSAAIFTINPDGTKRRQVTHPAPGAIDTEPDWAPDGKRIAFERQSPCPAGGAKDGLQNTCDLVYTVRPNGKGLKLLVPCRFKVATAAGTPFSDCVGVDQPAWSPDGSRLAFQYNLVDRAYTGTLNTDAGIWIINADGTGMHQVTGRKPSTGWDFGPQWSPDGRKLVFYRADFVANADAVFTVNADGRGEHQVTPWQLNGGNSPDWSPNGQWLLFTGAPGDGSQNLYKIHPDGTGLTMVTHEPADGHHYLSSSFSPDGTKITTARTPGTGAEGAADVFVLNADGSSIRPVTNTRLWESGADWGPRGRERR
jgi:Tol biopolymer transport system component